MTGIASNRAKETCDNEHDNVCFRAHNPILIGAVARALPQVISTCPIPGRVSVPIVHDHDAFPLASVVFDTRPAALLFVPAGVKYVIVHCVFGGPPIEADAWPPTGAPCTVIVTVAGGDGGGVFVLGAAGALVGTGIGVLEGIGIGVFVATISTACVQAQVRSKRLRPTKSHAARRIPNPLPLLIGFSLLCNVQVSGRLLGMGET